MDETNPTTAATQVALECLTLWLQPDRQRAIDHIANLQVDPSGPGPTNLIVGLLNLSSWLLFSLAETQGEATDAELVEKAKDILDRLSEQLIEEQPGLHATTEGGSGAE
jgi:hypothetical protein